MRLICQIALTAVTGTAGFFAFSGLWAHFFACAVCAVAIFLVTPGRGD